MRFFLEAVSVSLLATAILTAGCDPVDGSDPYGLWDIYEDSTASFHFHYLAPPWETPDGSSAEDYRLVVDPGGEPLDVNGMPGDGLDAAMGLEIETSKDEDAVAEASADHVEWKKLGVILEPVVEFENIAGDVGVKISAEADDRSFVAVYQDFAEGGSVRLVIVGKEDVDTHDVGLLLESLEARSARGDR